jgi:hypothetical protein
MDDRERRVVESAVRMLREFSSDGYGDRRLNVAHFLESKLLPQPESLRETAEELLAKWDSCAGYGDLTGHIQRLRAALEREKA